MDLLMNGLLTVATLFAGGYCWVLSRRVNDLKSLDKGLGASIVTLTRQVELARTTLEEAREASKTSQQDLAQLVGKADAAAGQLRMLIAAAPIVPPSAVTPPVARPAPSVSLAAAEAALEALATPPLAAPEARGDANTARKPRRSGLKGLLSEAPAPSLPKIAATETVPTPLPAVDLPKPRTPVPIENPLRRFRAEAITPTGTPSAGGNEEDLLDALRALAGTER